MPSPVFDDANIEGALALSLPTIAESFGTEDSSLVLSPWAKEQHVEDCDPAGAGA